MANLKLRKLARCRILATMFISAALAVAIYAQSPPRLQVEVGPNQQVRILASNVSCGEVLRALRGKLGWEIEIPSLADELKVPYFREETTQAQVALAKLLEGTSLGYAFLHGANGIRNVKVLVIPSMPREANGTQNTTIAPPVANVGGVEASLPLADRAQTATIIQPNAVRAEPMAEQPSAPLTMPLSEAINAIGAPPGVPLDDVGKRMTLPMSEAARKIGAPPGTSPGDVGKTIILPLPTGPGRKP